ncbi:MULTISPECIES: hypothetical protein [Nonlabens]|uniref:Uncharacterized protein n=1 Tax=Nonlabens xylanidelens TaxID=191564 RepID=A0A2S6IGH1_9FLAO|nr:hypothetical protein [Nonlabens xylanidelens]PPK93308.1 hypothetical protein LY01_02593 [Nonlabens xylanidelens]PQJ20873.1 hypothetical protein BST94_05115 [Nonlabens xylanidelens]
MIIIKYLVFYTFVGFYQSTVFIKSSIRAAINYIRSLNESRNEQGQVVGFKTTLLRTAFRSIL